MLQCEDFFELETCCELISYIKKNWSGVHFSLDGSLLLMVQIKSGFVVLSLINITACLSSKMRHLSIFWPGVRMMFVSVYKTQVNATHTTWLGKRTIVVMVTNKQCELLAGHGIWTEVFCVKIACFVHQSSTLSSSLRSFGKTSPWEVWEVGPLT